jgi:hypothetical protein
MSTKNKRKEKKRKEKDKRKGHHVDYYTVASAVTLRKGGFVYHPQLGKVENSPNGGKEIMTI